MAGNTCGAGGKKPEANELFELSRPLRHDEKADYFMSHSWHDDAEAKWDALVRFAEQFKAKTGRYPTFWLDKVCMRALLLKASLGK